MADTKISALNAHTNAAAASNDLLVIVDTDAVETKKIALSEFDSRFAAASHSHAAGDITSGTLADARVAQSNVTQHEAALTITESQISDLGSYIENITAEAIGDLSDVTITAIASGEILAWNGSAFINRTLSEAGIAAAAHTHTESDITDLGNYIENITAEAIGDLSDVTITAIASGELLAWNGTAFINRTLAEAGIAAASHTHTESEITDLGSYIENVSEDTTPQLGGNLDVAGNSIVSASDGDIAITPNGTGDVILDGLKWPQADGTDGQVLKTDGAGQLSWQDDSSSGSSSLDGLTDVVITSVADGELIVYDSGGNWINQTLAEAGVAAASHTHTESDITDLGSYIEDITAEDIGDLANVTITDIASGEILTWNGSAFINNTLAEAGIAAASHTHDHGAITGLTDDDHTQYVLLAGRSGGQDVIGGTAASNALTLESTSHGTKGKIQSKDQHQFDGSAHFGSEVDNGNSSTADTIAWTAGNKQASTLTGNCTFTFTAPEGSCNLILKLIQDGTGSRTVTWPASVKWPGGTAPTLTTDAAAIDIVSFYFDGTNYYGMAGLDFS